MILLDELEAAAKASIKYVKFPQKHTLDYHHETILALVEVARAAEGVKEAHFRDDEDAWIYRETMYEALKRLEAVK